VCSGNSGHAEAVQMIFNPKEVSYKELTDLFFKKHDPTTLNRQGGDCGTQYRSAVFYHSEEQKAIAEEAKARIPKAVTEIVPAGTFWPAEEYHQQYLVIPAEIAINVHTRSIVRCMLASI
jgi:methionine-S-sulfoxide reductase